MKRYNGLKVKIFKIFLSLLLLNSCSEEKYKPLTIAVASSFEHTADQILQEFIKENPEFKDSKIISNASGTLATQIINGAPFDVFLSADIEKPNLVYQTMVDSSIKRPRTYANGTLAFWSPNSNFEINSNKCLDESLSSKTVVIANPETAPYGKLAEQIIESNHLKLNQTVHATNALQAFLYIESKFADSGFIAYSSLIQHEIDYGCIQLFNKHTIPQAVILINSKALPFYQFLFSEKAQKLVQLNGFQPILPNEL